MSKNFKNYVKCYAIYTLLIGLFKNEILPLQTSKRQHSIAYHVSIIGYSRILHCCLFKMALNFRDHNTEHPRTQIYYLFVYCSAVFLSHLPREEIRANQS